VDRLTGIQNFPGPSLRGFLETCCILGYIVLANVWTFYFLPEMMFLDNPWVIGVSILFPAGGLLLGGLNGLVKGSLIFPFGIALINAAFFPFYLLGWLGGLAYGFLRTIPFPLVGSLGNLAVLILVLLPLLLMAVIGIFAHDRDERNPESDEADDYSSPSFTPALGGGRWGGI
jgi:hypothetical protein